MEEKIKNWIKETLQIDSGPVLMHPKDLKNGDYTLVSSPEKAQIEFDKLNKNKLKEIEKIELAGIFINFYLSPEFFADSVKEISKDKNFGQGKSLKGQKTIVEHTDPNPFKEFHVGHLMTNTIGSTVANILAWNGAETKQACYQGDAGLHVAKAVWAMMKHRKSTLDAYAFGHKAYEESDDVKKEVTEINKKIYDKSDEEVNKFYKKGKEESLKYFDEVYKKLGTKFNYFFFESEVGAFGKELVEKNVGKVFERGDGGALIFRGEKYDKALHTRVFVNKDGLPTYEAKELGLAKVKYEKYKYEKSVIITGNEINDYFRVLLAAMKEIFPELAEKTVHLSHGMLRLPTGKMSSRTGDVITAEALVDEVKGKVKGDERVAIAAIKYMILRQSIGGDIIFDIEKSVSTEGDSGVYLQYSYARAHSILAKAKEEGVKPNAKLPDGWATIELEKFLYRFPEVVERAGEEFAPHYITSYLTELARAYNSFYGNNVIVKKDDPASPYKIALNGAFATTIKNGLEILGIPVLEKM